MKLNLGCGQLRIAGYLGVDSHPDPGVDVVTDLTEHPWPYEHESVDGAITWHFLEHLPGFEFHRAIDEIHRVLRPGAVVYIKVPYRERGPYHPFHFRVFNRETFDSWIADADGCTGKKGCLQYEFGRFRRLRQEVVSLSGFPVWHIVHHFPRGEGWLFHRDERGAWSRIPSGAFSDCARELREWLVKL